MLLTMIYKDEGMEPYSCTANVVSYGALPIVMQLLCCTATT